MPWRVEVSAACPAGEPWAVIKEPDGSVAGCHASVDDANRQMAALYAAEPEVAEAAVIVQEAVEVPTYVADNARRGLRYYEEGRGGEGLVAATISAARQMASGSVSENKVRLMGPWIARHLADLDAPQNSDASDPGYPGPGLVAMLLWGAGPTKEDATRTMEWAERITSGLQNEMQEAGWYTPATGDSGGNGIVLTKMLEAMSKALEEELAGLSKVEEVGRVFSTKNEMALRAVVDAINSLLGQLAAAPVVATTGDDEEDEEVIVLQPVQTEASGEQPEQATPEPVASVEAAPAETPSAETAPEAPAQEAEAPVADQEQPAAEPDAVEAVAAPEQPDEAPATEVAPVEEPPVVEAEPAPASEVAAPTEVTLDPDAVEAIAEEAVGVPISEGARSKGLIKVIDSGWGSSGYYPVEVLRRDAAIAFPSGTKMYWDHPSKAEAEQRPERSLRDLAAETVTPAAWMDNGPEGPGVYATAKVFTSYAPTIEELAPHIGVSIRASAMVKKGKAENRSGAIIEKLLPSPMNSIDFVTIAGRGGRVANLFEAARGKNMDVVTVDEAETLRTEIAELRASLSEAETLRNEVANLKSSLAETETQRDDALRSVAAYKTAAIVGDIVSASDLPAAAKARIAASFTAESVTVDEDALKAAVAEKVAAEKSYIDEIRGTGEVRNMGSASVAPATEKAVPDMAESFRRIGLSETAAAIAAQKRQ